MEVKAMQAATKMIASQIKAAEVLLKIVNRR
jgi:hypothetical protein